LSLMAGRGFPLAAAPSKAASGGCERVSSLAACTSCRGKWSCAGAGAGGGDWLGTWAGGIVGAAARAMTCSGCSCSCSCSCSGAVRCRHLQVKGRQRAGCGTQKAGNARSAEPVMQSQLPADIADALALRHSRGGCARRGRVESVGVARRRRQSSHVHMPEVCAARVRGLVGCTCRPAFRATPDCQTLIISTFTLACHLQSSRGAISSSSHAVCWPAQSLRLPCAALPCTALRSVAALLTPASSWRVCNTGLSYCLRVARCIEYLLREPVDLRETMHAHGNYLGLVSVTVL